MPHSHVERIHAEPVVLDIGGTIGALIILTDPEAVGHEIELSRKGEDLRFHNQVHERSFYGNSLFAAVYPDMREGEYSVWGEGEEPVATVVVPGGEVVTLDWRTTS